MPTPRSPSDRLRAKIAQDVRARRAAAQDTTSADKRQPEAIVNQKKTSRTFRRPRSRRHQAKLAQEGNSAGRTEPGVYFVKPAEANVKQDEASKHPSRRLRHSYQLWVKHAQGKSAGRREPGAYFVQPAPKAPAGAEAKQKKSRTVERPERPSKRLRDKIAARHENSLNESSNKVEAPVVILTAPAKNKRRAVRLSQRLREKAARNQAARAAARNQARNVVTVASEEARSKEDQSSQGTMGPRRQTPQIPDGKESAKPRPGEPKPKKQNKLRATFARLHL